MAGKQPLCAHREIFGANSKGFETPTNSLTELTVLELLLH